MLMRPDAPGPVSKPPTEPGKAPWSPRPRQTPSEHGYLPHSHWWEGAQGLSLFSCACLFPSGGGVEWSHASPWGPTLLWGATVLAGLCSWGAVQGATPQRPISLLLVPTMRPVISSQGSAEGKADGVRARHPWDEAASHMGSWWGQPWEGARPRSCWQAEGGWECSAEVTIRPMNHIYKHSSEQERDVN